MKKLSIIITIAQWMTLVFKWSVNNSKVQALGRVLNLRSASFDLLAGKTCPKANICKAHVEEISADYSLIDNMKAFMKALKLKVVKGNNAQFLCYAAKLEAVFKYVYFHHKYNTNKVLEFIRTKNLEGLVSALISDITTLNIQVIRIHSSGDLFNKLYTMAFIKVARALPHVSFFGYTKVYESWQLIKNADLNNIKFAFSFGSMDDKYLTGDECISYVCTSDETFEENGKLYCHNPFGKKVEVVCHEETDESESADYFKIMSQESFALLVH